jgi:aquaporin Z
VIEQSAAGLYISGATSWYLFLALGCSLYSVYYILSPISGGHFNPAVSIAVYISLAFNLNNIVILLMILVAQFLGAFVGMLLSRGLRTLID